MKRQPNSAEKSAPSAALPPLPQTSNFRPAQRHSAIASTARVTGWASSCNDSKVSQAAQIDSCKKFATSAMGSLQFWMKEICCRYNRGTGVATDYPKRLLCPESSRNLTEISFFLISGGYLL